MKKAILLLTFILFNSSVISGQEIEMKSTFWGLKFTQNDQNLKLKDLAKAVESNLKAQELIEKGKKQYTVANIFAVVGGGFIGFPLGQSIGGEDPNWTLAYIGGGFTLVALPFALSGFNNLNKGVDTYNLSLKKSSSYQFKPKFNIYSTGTGLGLTMQF